MRPYTRTTKRLAVLSLVITVLAFIAWQFALPRMGWLSDRPCTFSTDSGTREYERAELVSLWKTKQAKGEGFAAHSVSCAYAPAFDSNDLTLSERGLTQAAETLDKDVQEVFDGVPYGGFEPGGATTGHIAGSAHYEGRAIDYFFRPYQSAKQNQAGWQLAQWAVLMADKYDISTIIYDDHIWERNLSFEGWRPYTHPDGPTDNPIKRHLDHVHIDVR